MVAYALHKFNIYSSFAEFKINVRRKIINNREFGNIGEDIACRYLMQIGYKIVTRNFQCKQGEIDIIAKEKDEYVFIEVKTRSNICYGRPREAVNEYKQKHIYKATKYYLHINRLENCFVRFDVIEIYCTKNKYKVRHLKQVEISDGRK